MESPGTDRVGPIPLKNRTWLDKPMLDKNANSELQNVTFYHFRVPIASRYAMFIKIVLC